MAEQFLLQFQGVRKALLIIELKKNRTPRDVIAQAIDYASWVQNLLHEKILDIRREKPCTFGRSIC
jgi:hypothetical protein